MSVGSLSVGANEIVRLTIQRIHLRMLLESMNFPKVERQEGSFRLTTSWEDFYRKMFGT